MKNLSKLNSLITNRYYRKPRAAKFHFSIKSKTRSNHSQLFYEIAVLTFLGGNLQKNTDEEVVLSSKTVDLICKVGAVHVPVFSCGFCETFQSHIFQEHLTATER